MQNPNRPICHNFVDDMNCELNRLLYKCTGLKNLVNPFELSMNTLGAYMKDSNVAERRVGFVPVFFFCEILTCRILFIFVSILMFFNSGFMFTFVKMQCTLGNSLIQHLQDLIIVLWQ